MGQYVAVIVGFLIALSIVLALAFVAYDGLRVRPSASDSGSERDAER
jgi:hypothetical protein